MLSSHTHTFCGYMVYVIVPSAMQQLSLSTLQPERLSSWGQPMAAMSAYRSCRAASSGVGAFAASATLPVGGSPAGAAGGSPGGGGGGGAPRGGCDGSSSLTGCTGGFDANTYCPAAGLGSAAMPPAIHCQSFLISYRVRSGEYMGTLVQVAVSQAAKERIQG